MSEMKHEWFLGSMSDGLFIINMPPRPSTDDVWPERPDGPTIALSATDLPVKKAQAICDAHNAVIATLQLDSAFLRERLEKMEKENEQLRYALEPFAHVEKYEIPDSYANDDMFRSRLRVNDFRIARAAIQGGDNV